MKILIPFITLFLPCCKERPATGKLSQDAATSSPNLEAMCKGADIKDLPVIVERMRRAPDVDSKSKPVSMGKIINYNILIIKGKRTRDIAAAVESGRYHCYAWFSYKVELDGDKKVRGILYDDNIEYFEGAWE